MLLQEITMMLNSRRCNGLNRIVCHQSILCSYPSLCITSPWTSIFLVRHLHNPVKKILLKRQDGTVGYWKMLYQQQ